jgi:hypothetical protein
VHQWTHERARSPAAAHVLRASGARQQQSEPVAPAIVHTVLQSPGQPLDPVARAGAEARFGRDFSRIRIHSDARAAAFAMLLRSQAYAVGRHLVFGAGEYAPGSDAGRRLLDHELTHWQGVARRDENQQHTTYVRNALLPDMRRIENPHRVEASTGTPPRISRDVFGAVSEPMPVAAR